MKYRYAVAACARWETPYIVEWLNYYRAIGFGHVFLYCNDDDPAELYERVLPFTQGPQPFVTFRHHPHQGEQPQMYGHFLLHHLHECEWVGFFDIDEFLRLPAGETIADFAGRFGGTVDCILFNWIFFGPNGHKTPPAGPVLTNYTRRSENLHPFTKYITKSSIFSRHRIANLAGGDAFWHTPQPMSEAPIKIVNVLGEDMQDYYAGFENDASPFVNQWDRKSRILATAFVHHYAFRSEDSFWERSRRGLKGRFAGQTIWREMAESERFPAFLKDVNAVLDMGLAEFWTENLEQTLRNDTGLKLGISITTLNRRDMVLALVEKIRALTRVEFDLVVCDDGSADGTLPALQAAGVTVIGGTPRGIAWNKNRGLYYLLNVRKCDVIILMDDDITPVAAGWEAEWMESTWRYGHMNYALPAFQSSLVAGAATAADPGLSSMVPGTAFAVSRVALAQMGYLDLRFGRYGHEHSDFSFRALRAGFGGLKVREGGWDAPYFYVITGRLEVLPAATSGTQEELAANFRLLNELANEPIYRHAWLSDEMRNEFLGEIEEALGPMDTPLRLKNHFASWRDQRNAAGVFPGEPAPTPGGMMNLALRKSATQSSISEWSTGPTPARDAAGAVNGRADGRRKFHTAFEHNPWWQVDLGGFTTIHEIHIYNTIEPTADRFTNFILAISIDGDSWAEIARKEDGVVVGGTVDGPFVWNGPGTAWGRFVRITALGQTYLHLDQVEVYGTTA